jgi:hypothetical protein
MLVSIITRSAGSVADSARPALPNTFCYLGHGADELVGLLQNLPRLAHRDIGRCGGHVHDVPLIERRYELGAQVLERPEARHRHHGGDGQGGFGRASTALSSGT